MGFVELQTQDEFKPHFGILCVIYFGIPHMAGAQPKGFQQHAQSGEYAQGRGREDHKIVAAQPKHPNAADSAV
ncbi:hypothetical protein OIU79_021658 [Salix purpurea]|uniref:Uncharacterized protein n=1 Tax=Salix purpurea TaxID=77065 RepID=A0A9Q1ABY0_SALPP|nr:hypothetical protein OIU79_021658 [Salix purpurea]